MTKKEASAIFARFLLPYVATDKPARREAWGEYTDALQKSGQITMQQYEDWTPPCFVETRG